MARFPTPAVPELLAELAAQPVEASGPQVASVPMEQKVRLAQAQSVPRVPRARLAVSER